MMEENKMRKLLLFIFCMTIFLLTACSQEENPEQGTADEDTISVYTTLYPLEYFTKQIGKEFVNVQTILPQGSDPHSFEPTSKMMVDIAEADLFIYNGADMESYAKTMEDALKQEEVSILEAADGISLTEHHHENSESESEEAHSHNETAHIEESDTHEEDSHEHESDHEHGDVDPHIWLDPLKSVQLAENIKERLIELLPEQTDYFEENFHQLEERLIQLDTSFHTTIDNAKKKEILVTHAAYGYWEQSYGLQQLAISGISPSDEPSQKEIERIIERVKEHGIKYLLFEQNIEPKVASVIQEEANVESLQLHNISVLTEEDVSNEEDYFTLMERNLEVLKEALEY